MKTHQRKISVVISGMPSVGKTTAAEAISERFGLYHLGGGDILKQMALDKGYEPAGSEWWDSAEGMKFLAERERNEDFDKEVDKRLLNALKQGGVVMTSYPVPWLTTIPLKFWFDASPNTRARRLAGRDSIPVRKALEIIHKRDLENRKLYKRLYGINFGSDLSVFNFVVNTEKLTAKQVSLLSCEIVEGYKATTQDREEEERN